MGKRFAVWDALATRAELFDSIVAPGIPLSLPNQGFDPATDAPDGRYLEVSHFRNRPAWEGVTSGVQDQGLFQIVVVWPPHVSLNDAERVADELIAHFPKGLELYSGGVKVKVASEPFDGSPIIDDDRVSIPVTIPWKA